MTVTDLIPDRYHPENLQEAIRNPTKFTREFTRAVHAAIDVITLDREALVEYAETSGDVWYYGRERTVEIREPSTNQVPSEFTELPGEHTSPPEFVCELPNAELIGPYTIPKTESGRLVLEPFGVESTFRTCMERTWADMGKVGTFAEIAKSTPKERQPRYETAVSLVPRHGRHIGHVNYGHWIGEQLPQLRAVEAYERETGRTPQLLIKPDPPSWMTETLNLMGYTSNAWTEWNDGVARVKRLVVPKLSWAHSHACELNPAGRQWVNERMVKSVDRENVSKEFSPRIFITRESADRRRILNIDEVKEALRPLGFEFYQPHTLTMEEEVALFSQANVVVGTVGSGIGGIIYSTDANLIELFPADHFGVYYLVLANELGLTYDFLRGVSPKENQDGIPIHHDFRVNVDALLEVVGTAIG